MINNILNQFGLDSTIKEITEINQGNINNTYKVEFIEHDPIIVQRINSNVFSKVESLISNAELILNSKFGNYTFPKILKTKEKKSFYKDSDNFFWRIQTYIKETRSFDKIESIECAFEFGKILGYFHKKYWNKFIPLKPVIANFHNTSIYKDNYLNINKQIDINDQLFHEMILAEPDIDLLQNLLQEKKIKKSVIHGDPKINNVLFEKDSLKAKCLIDFDTLMNGPIHYDIGDALRSICNQEGEETNNFDNIEFDLNICEQFFTGYFEAVHDIKDSIKSEIRYFFDSIRIITYELGVRFFTDHLNQNQYFKVDYHGQNLNRARVQFYLLNDLKKKSETINEIILKTWSIS